MKINGTPVEDATKSVRIVITPKDVIKGQTKDPAGCAAALAACREMNAEQARVHIGRTYLKIGKKWIRYHTSRALRSEIVAFDRGGKFEPGEYMLTPMQPAKRATGKRQGSNKPHPRSDRKHPKRAKPHVVTGIRAHGANR